MVLLLRAAALAAFVRHGLAAATPTLSTALPSLTISTAVPSPSAPLNSPLPAQASPPPAQPWCIGQIFCPGSVSPLTRDCPRSTLKCLRQLLQTVNIAQLYSDSKTFVDKPTRKPVQQVLADFAAFDLSTVTEDDIVNFVDDDFGPEGLELEAASLAGFTTDPAFLNNVTDTLVRAFAQIVHGYWTQLARNTNHSALCNEYPVGGCESTLIPLNHTFIVPGGRFREQCQSFFFADSFLSDVVCGPDYWDSYWIVQGLLKSELYDAVNATLHNFMDEIMDYGFIPNGGRTYCKIAFGRQRSV